MLSINKLLIDLYKLLTVSEISLEHAKVVYYAKKQIESMEYR